MKLQDKNRMFVMNWNEENGKYVIRNKYKDWETGVAACYEDAFDTLMCFVQKHTVDGTACGIKRLATCPSAHEYVQLQALFSGKNSGYIVQVYDNEFILRDELQTQCKTEPEILNWMREHFTIVRGLSANVYRRHWVTNNWDSTNGGASSRRVSLSLLTFNEHCSLEATDLRYCLIPAYNEEDENTYCYPAYKMHRPFTMGGNFLYSPDALFKEVTGTSYPIPIHDRCE